MRRLEEAFVEAFRVHLAPLLAAAPTSPEAIVAWFGGLKTSGPGQLLLLFDWLETGRPRSKTSSGSASRKRQARRVATTSSPSPRSR